MGGTLQPNNTKGPPRFLVLASKDPRGAHLDRVQIIKAWVDSEGKSFEKIFDVRASGSRAIDPQTYRAQPIGNTVDVPDASYTNTIGSAILETLWSDPEFDASVEASHDPRELSAIENCRLELGLSLDSSFAKK